MKSKIIFLIFFFIGVKSNAQVSGVGINKDNPQQALHLGSQTGTIRVDGLNSTNNDFNGGEVDKTYPLYVDHNGDMTLETSAYNNSDGGDAFLSTDPINSELVMTVAQIPNDGYEVVEITSYSFTVDRNTVLEIKYSLSIEVFQTNLLTTLRDPYARNITNFFTLNTPVLTSTTRRYAAHSKCYFNYNYELGAASPPNASTGYIYNSGTSYIYLTPGTHTLRFYGTLCAGSANRNTFVRFAGGPDAVFLKLH